MRKTILWLVQRYGTFNCVTGIVSGCLLVVAVVGLVERLPLANSDKTACHLLDGRHFTDRELVDVRTALAKANLNDYEVTERGLVKIPADKKSRYISALAAADALPQRPGDQLARLAKAKINLFESPNDRAMRFADRQAD